jgi:hypothetical protein
MPNEGHKRVEFCPRWDWENGSVSYGPTFSDPVVVQAFLDKPPVGVVRGEMVERTITTTPWTPVLPPGVLRLDQLSGCEEYGGIRVAELGEGVVEGYTVVAFTDDVEKAFAAVRAHMVMVHNESPQLSLFREDEPVRWWQVYSTCGCGDTCPHTEDEDHEGCKRTGLPPCWEEEDGGITWQGELCDKDAPGAVPVVEIEAGDSFTPDEWVTLLQRLLGDAERRLRKLSKTCVAVKTSLDKPYPDAPETTPWAQFVERPTRDAYALAQEIKQTLKGRGVAS